MKLFFRKLIKRARNVFGAVRGDVTFSSVLFGTVRRLDGSVVNLGCLGTKLVTNDGAAYLVKCLKGDNVASDLKYHGWGSGSTAENVTDAALGAQIGARVIGSQLQGDTANVYKTVATLTASGSQTIREHGLFSASVAGKLLDRTVFPANVALANGETIEFTYTLTINAGG